MFTRVYVLKSWRYMFIVLTLLFGMALLGGNAFAGRLANSSLLSQEASSPLPNDAYMELVPGASGNCPAPSNGGSTQVGCRFVLDLMLDAGSNEVTAQQSYMTFTYQLIQNARVSSIGTSCVPTNTVTGDLTTFDATLQNEVCNGPNPCNFRGVIVDPGSMAYASGALMNCPEGCTGRFRVASIGLCMNAPGEAILHWQFSPPDPPNRNTDIICFACRVNHALFRDYVIFIGVPTNTPTATATVCVGVGDYTVVTTTGTIISGTQDIGNHCDDCTTAITFPFPIAFYGVQYTSGNASSNGNLQFVGNTNALGIACLPSNLFTGPTALLYQGDLHTGGTGEGIFSATLGTAPNRTYILEWRTHYFNRTGTSNEELVFFENNPNLVRMVYGPNVDNGLSEISGVQYSLTGPFTEYSCQTATLTNGLQVDYLYTGAGCVTATPSNTAIRTNTPTVTATPTCSPFGAWRISPETYNGELYGVAAVSSNDVWAVGGYLAEHWNGSTWSLVPLPNPGGDLKRLQGVAAISSNDVWAVGYFNNYPISTLIEHWDGSAWSIVPSPNQGTNASYLQSVAALSSNNVWAVGYYANGSGEPYRTLIEHWDGSAWSIVPSTNPGDQRSVLNGVTAVSADDIWAVGYYCSACNTSPELTLTEHWDGSTWNFVPGPSPGTTNNSLYGVAAVSSNDVWAVGDSCCGVGTALTEHWNGSSWSLVSGPNPSRDHLAGVAAVSSDDVWAVGWYSGGGPSLSHAESIHWNGSAWSIVSMPDRGALRNNLAGVAAVSSNDVWAVGDNYVPPPGNTLTEHYASGPCATVTGTPPTNTRTPSPTSTRTATPTCPPGWTIYPNPAPPGESTLNGVTAIGPNDLWAVGYYTGTDRPHTLTVHGDGTNWTQVPSPDPGSSDVVLSGVAGVAANDVWAVGWWRAPPYNNLLTLTEHWDGTAWTIVPSPNGPRGQNHLYAVTAVASNDVWAVGDTNGGFVGEVLIEHWNGSTWTYQTGPQPTSAQARLYGVAAVSATDVWAVGGTYQGTLVVHWNGSAWSIVPSPNGNGTLYGVTAVATNDVWAVGTYAPNYGTQTLIEHWNGSAWTVVPSPSPGATINHLYGVSALSANNVWAVGDTDSEGGGTMTLAEHWDGTAWTQVPTPASPTGRDHLYGVVVTGGGVVWTVGELGCTSGCSRNALIMRYGPLCTPTPTPTPCNPTWRTVSSPSGGYYNDLNAVAVVSDNDIWAVGTYAPNNGAQTLIEHWDGRSWSIVPSPSPNVSNLYGIAAVAANDIWAVGDLVSDPLILHWNGTSWSIVPSPSPGASNNILYGVAAVAANDIWAVGLGNGSLTEHWNGTSWSIVPNPGTVNLRGVAAVAANDVWAVGYIGSQTQILHWNGTSWSIVPSPIPGTLYNTLNGVAAVAANDVWAVGYYTVFGPSDRTLIEHWNGTNWSIVPSANPGSNNYLYGIAAVAANDIWAVGEYVDGSGAYRRTLAEHWNGTSWSVVPSPNGSLRGVAAVAANDIWAVGNRQNSNTTLTVHYSGTCGAATVTPTNTRTPTNTSTPPTSTPSRTPTATPNCYTYTYATATCTIAPGTTDTGNHTDDGITTINLPFPVSFYGQSYTQANLSSNGNLQFVSSNTDYVNFCLPVSSFNTAVFVHWDDLRTDQSGTACSAFPTGCGIFTAVIGGPPNRTFNIEWRTQYYVGTGVANFEVQFYEGSDRFTFVYGRIDQHGDNATVGVQRGTGLQYLQYECNTGGITEGLCITFNGSCRTPIPTATGTPPTSTPTRTPTPCAEYVYATSTATIVPGTTDTGNHCDDCATLITLPFEFRLYSTTYITTNISSNGALAFGRVTNVWPVNCLPNPNFGAAILPHSGDDLRTDASPGCAGYPGGNCGVFTSVSGSAPNRIFNIEWRTAYFSGPGSASFEVRLYEGLPSRFDIILGTLSQGGTGATIGVQDGTDHFTQFSCNTSVPNNLRIAFSLGSCNTPTPTLTPALMGHVTWDGRQPQPDPSQILPITLTLRSRDGGPYIDYPAQNTDESGYFTVPVAGLASGEYYWRVKGPKYLANWGTLTLTGAPITRVEMGLMRAGDANDDNFVNVPDFNILKVAFGWGCGYPWYDDRADFTGDCYVNVRDFNLMKRTFGMEGAPQIRP